MAAFVAYAHIRVLAGSHLQFGTKTVDVSEQNFIGVAHILVFASSCMQFGTKTVDFVDSKLSLPSLNQCILCFRALGATDASRLFSFLACVSLRVDRCQSGSRRREFGAARMRKRSIASTISRHDPIHFDMEQLRIALHPAA